MFGYSLLKKPAMGMEVPPEIFNWRLAVLVAVASCGGVIFGYDLSFVSGVFSLGGFQKRFELRTAAASTHLQTNVVATFQGGAFFGVILMFFFNERYGRRVALIMAGVIFDIGVILQIASNGNVPVFYVGRIVSGLGIGGSSFVVPQYLSENAPAIARGALIGCFEIGTQVGSITGFWVNYGVNLHLAPTDRQWMVPIGFQFIPVTILVIGLCFLNESPRWLYLKGRPTEAARALSWVRYLPEEHPFVQAELADYERQFEREEDITSGAGFMTVVKETFSPTVRFRLFIGCIMQIFLNSTGVNAFNNFAVSFFQALGFSGTSVKLLASGIYGVVKGVVASLTFIFLLDKFGRRPLLFIGSIGVVFSMFYLAAFASITNSFRTTQQPNSASFSAVAFIYIYGAAFSIGWQIPWILAAEIYPTRVRSFCMALTTCTHWIGEFYTSYSVSFMIANITYGVFLFYGVMTLLGGLFVYFYVPETMGKVLEDMDPLFEQKGFARQQMRSFDEWKMAQMTLHAHDKDPEHEVTVAAGPGEKMV